jgi:microsomal dipeptidase-like Zn-dependent dipeptidase
MDRLGTILDATHLVMKALEALDHFKVSLASHNNCRELVPHNRRSVTGRSLR